MTAPPMSVLKCTRKMVPKVYLVLLIEAILLECSRWCRNYASYNSRR